MIKTNTSFTMASPSLIPPTLEDLISWNTESAVSDILQFILDNYTMKTDSDYLFKDENLEYKLIDVFNKIIRLNETSILEALIINLPQSLGLDLNSYEERLIEKASQELSLGSFLLLMENGMVLSQEQKDQTLIRACENGHNEFVEKLIELGADPNAYIEIKKQIIKKGNRGGFGSKSGSKPPEYKIIIHSALSFAIDIDSDSSESDLVLCLLNAGANPNAHEGLALGAASKVSSDKIFKSLIDAGADVVGCKVQLIKNAIENKNVELIELLLDHGADVSDITHGEIRKLAKRCDVNLLRKLVERGLDISGLKPDHPRIRIQEISSYLTELGMNPNDICELLVPY